MGNWRKYFIDGIAILIPFILSVIIVVWLVEFFTYPLRHWLSHLTHHRVIAHVLSFILSIAFITGFGFLVRKWILGKFVKAIHHLFLRIPFVRTVYKSCEQAISALFSKKDRAFTAVVTFEYGNTNGMVIGLVPQNSNVFENHIPIMHTGPSPLHNLILFVDKDRLKTTEIPIENALRWSISAGSAPLREKS